MMNSPAASPDRGSTLVLIDDMSGGGGGGSSSTTPAATTTTATPTAQSSSNSSLRTAGMMAAHPQQSHHHHHHHHHASSSTHPPDPLLYGLQTMEWRPWLRPSPGSSSTMDEYAKSTVAAANVDANDEYSNYASKNAKSVHFCDQQHQRHESYAPLDMHGVVPCRRAFYWWAKAFWTLIIMAAVGGLAYEMYKTISDEFWWTDSHSGSYTIRRGSASAGGGSPSLPFPDIYVCPTNPVNETYRRRRRTDMKWFQILTALNQKSNPEGILGKLLVNWDYNSQATGSSSVIVGPPSTNSSPSDQQQQQWNPNLLDELPVDPAPSPMSIDSMKEYFMRNGYDSDGFLVECSFRSKSFKCSELAQPTLDRKHGKCFLFPFSSGVRAWPQSFSALAQNTGGGGSPLANTSAWRVSNGAHGFSLAMNIHTELNPKENGSLFDGAYLYVDWRNDPASMFDSKPILLPPGAYSTITLESRQIRTRKLDPSCNEDEEVSSDGTTDGGGGGGQRHRTDRHNWLVLNSPRYYREDLCKFDCLLQSIIDICHCLLLIDGRYVNRSSLVLEKRTGNESDPFSFSTTTWSTIGYCTAEQLSECTYDVLQQYDSSQINDVNTNNCTRRCRPSCQRHEYNLVGNSYLKLPAESYLGSGPNYPFPWNELKNNFVLVDIVVDKGRTIVVEEGPAMSLEMFLGIIGGQMSLFLGASLLTIVQIVILVLSCCKSTCQRVYGGKCLTVRKTLRKMRHSSLLK